MAKKIEVDTPTDKVSHARSVRMTEYQISVTECTQLIAHLGGHLARMLDASKCEPWLSSDPRLYVTDENGNVRTIAFSIDRSA